MIGKHYKAHKCNVIDLFDSYKMEKDDDPERTFRAKQIVMRWREDRQKRPIFIRNVFRVWRVSDRRQQLTHARQLAAAIQALPDEVTIPLTDGKPLRLRLHQELLPLLVKQLLSHDSPEANAMLASFIDDEDGPLALFSMEQCVTTHTETSKFGKEIRGRIRQLCESVPTQTNITMRVAIRHEPFLNALPENLTWTCTNGTVDIKRTPGGKSHHVCVDSVLRDGLCGAIRFRLLTRGGGGTPVPYFGVRDANGSEEVLVLFSSYPKAEEVHEILLFRAGSRFGALYKNRLKTVLAGDLEENVYPFFHMNDKSRIFIEEIRLPALQTDKNAVNKAIDSDKK